MRSIAVEVHDKRPGRAPAAEVRTVTADDGQGAGAARRPRQALHPIDAAATRAKVTSREVAARLHGAPGERAGPQALHVAGSSQGCRNHLIFLEASKEAYTLVRPFVNRESEGLWALARS